VVQAMVYALRNDTTIGQVCSLVGPQTYSLHDLFALTGSYTAHPRPISEWSPKMAFWKRFFYPGDILQRGELGFMQLASHHAIDPITAAAMAAEMHISLTSLEDVASTYLKQSTDNA
jgi:hypothetical protein